VIDDIEKVDSSYMEAIIVSVPPDKHLAGVEIAAVHNKPVFVEASVVLEDVEKIKAISNGKIFVAPSCTFMFNPIIQGVKKIINSGKFGKVCNFSYHSGQYLPDWHPWESVNDFYVGSRLTGGGREIVPYEMTWIVDVFGEPRGVKGYFRKTIDMNCNIEDTYASVIDFGNMLGTLTVDVVARNAVRNLIINLERGQIQCRFEKKIIEVYDVSTDEWHIIEPKAQLHEEGYSDIIDENMYIEEIRAFLDGIKDPTSLPNTIDKDIKILELLTELEDSDGGYNRKI
jgi:predicted dehydrogenase